MARTKQTRRKIPATQEAIRLALQAKASGRTVFKHTTTNRTQQKGSDYITPTATPEYSEPEDNEDESDKEEPDEPTDASPASVHQQSDHEDDGDGAQSEMCIV